MLMVISSSSSGTLVLVPDIGSKGTLVEPSQFRKSINKHERANERNKRRAKRVMGQVSLPPSPSPPFIGKVGRKVSIILLVGFVFCNSASRGFERALNLTLH